MVFEMSFDPDQTVGDFILSYKAEDFQTFPMRTGTKKRYFLVKETGAVVFILDWAGPPPGTVYDPENPYTEDHWWVTDVLLPEKMIRIKDSILERELNEMEVLAWVSRS